MKNLVLAAAVLGLAGASFAAGRLSAPSTSTSATAAVSPRAAIVTSGVTLTENASPAPQAPNDPRELIPLGPGNGQQPGQRPGQQPGGGQQPAQCPVQIYQDGKLYTFPAPGQQPQPGGSGSQPGQPGQPQELIPLGPGGGGGNGGTVPSSPAAPTPPAPVNPKTRS